MTFRGKLRLKIVTVIYNDGKGTAFNEYVEICKKKLLKSIH